MADKERPKPPEPEAAPSEIPPGLVTGVDVETALRGVTFPATARDLMERARQNGTEEVVLDRLSDLPDRRFTSLGDALRALDMLS